MKRKQKIFDLTYEIGLKDQYINKLETALHIAADSLANKSNNSADYEYNMLINLAELDIANR